MFNRQKEEGNKTESATKKSDMLSPPTISLPKGGGAIRGIDEKFSVNPATGTGSLSIPIFTSPGRSDFSPELSLDYDSGSGNGPFGLGWNLSIPSITRKTDKGLPKYQDADKSDVFILSGAEDLVPCLKEIEDPNTGEKTWAPEDPILRGDYTVTRYRPRTEGLFARIEKWTRSGEIHHWRSISRDNITTLYGKDDNSRIFDPNDPDSDHPKRIFSWLICESYDDKGNAIVYEYEPEDSDGIDLSQVNEKNRTDESRSANRYIKRIKYGNKTSRLIEPDLSQLNWLFEVVFDYYMEKNDQGEYGQHYKLLAPDTNGPQFVQASTDEMEKWDVRQDPFSSYRAGFEVRTYRLCRRVLMFHHFPEELGVDDYLVRSTEFEYNEGPVASFITEVIQSGYVRQHDDDYPYLKKSLPAMEFEYSKVHINEAVEEIDAESLENLPTGLDGAQYHWIDLDGEGLSGILTEQAGAWFYKRNLGNTRFAPTRIMATKPSPGTLQSTQTQIMDLAGDGQKDLVLLDEPLSGFYERTQDGRWDAFVPFTSFPNIRWDDPNLRFVDLNGDGHADILLTEDDVFTWYPSKAEDGFGPSERVRKAYDEEEGPTLVLADGTQSIYLADVSGDGLSDLVRIRNGEICYWPNLGYGRFGTKVTMDKAPWFDLPDLFDQKRIRLADIDGSGTTDIIYLGRDGVSLYFNRSGNSWSEAHTLPQFPLTNNLSAVTVVDLLGNGTACLVWSSPLPGDAHQSMRYIDLMGGVKPHLLQSIKDNLGAETVLQYAPSTKFYLEDLEDGKPWITRLPFPVHVVERVETYDRISRNRSVTRYAYHHGYFDGIEREFRGFGRVDQWDTEEFATLEADGLLEDAENFNKASHVPPVLTKTWFHTGIYVDRDHVSDFFAGLIDAQDRGEYYREPVWHDDEVEARKHLLDDTVLPPGLTVDEEREACRALKGSMLRQEVYALDGTGTNDYPYGHPYTVTEQNFAIKRLQPQDDNRHAVFFTHAREAINYHYERNPAHPRISHALTLEVDEYGNVLRSIAVGYPRTNVPERQPEQNETHLTLTLNRLANRDDQLDWRHIGLPVETRTYEVVKPPTALLRFAWEELRNLIEALVPLGQVEPSAVKTIPYEQWDWRKQWNPQTEPGGMTNTRLRLIEHVRTLYRPDNLGAAQNNPQVLLPLGMVESLALPGESYKLAFTPGLLAQVYQRPREGQPPENLLPDPANVLPIDLPSGQIADRGGYVDLDGNNHWWIPTGRVFYSPNTSDTAAQELTYARQHFFLPHRYRDPFHTLADSTETVVTYDVYDLLVEQTTDPAENTVQARNDYRVLQPELITDPNRNRTATAFDALGMVVGTAVMGKAGQEKGDLLDGFEPDLTQTQIDEFYKAEDPHVPAPDLLNNATTRIIYDVDRFQRTRKEHPKEPEKWLPAYAATLARETHFHDLLSLDGLKIQISFSYSDGFGREIQKKIQAEPGLVDGVDTDPRWVGSGWTIFNNKGSPVKKYEPFFDNTHDFRFGKQVGVSSTLFYDPLGRVVATLHPNHTYEKVVFDPWRQETWDVNDTVLQLDPKTDPDVGEYFRRLPPEGYLSTWYDVRIDNTKRLLKWPDTDPESDIPIPENADIRKAEKSAAEKAANHAGTPGITNLDVLGRSFLTIADNGIDENGDPQLYETRVKLDIEGNQREVIDARGNKVMTYAYSMQGPEEEEEEDEREDEDQEEQADSHRIYQCSMDAGERWTLYNVTENPIRSWDSRNHEFIYSYDELQRPVLSHVKGGYGDTPLDNVFEKIMYGDWKNMTADQRVQSQKNNLIGQPKAHYDTAGKIEFEDYDFKGNLLRSGRQLTEDYKKIPNWSVNPVMEQRIFTSTATYDALNRPISSIAPDNSEIRPGYNEANLLEKMDARLRGASTWMPFVTNIDYNAKGQREKIEYANGVITEYDYDRDTFRLTNLTTIRTTDNKKLQDLHYTYDPVGNITHIRDNAQQTIYFNNTVVEPHADYTYDAVYRLIKATGREHLGQAGKPTAPDAFNDFHTGLHHPGDGPAMGTYVERYVYDAVGNILNMRHRGNNPAHPGWKRCYQYATNSNRLLSTGNPNTAHNPDEPCPTHYAATPVYAEKYDYDAHGNMKKMPHLQVMQWDFKDQLCMTQRQKVNDEDEEGIQRHGERTYYVYDAAGQRVRKVTELKNGNLKNERIYLGDFEIYREYNGNGRTIKKERETLHIMDDERRIALVETKTRDQGVPVPVPTPVIRYQLGNHLGSASLELGENGDIISYEEYYPYGSTSYQAGRSDVKVSLKRYRYISKERDEETGLYYHGARYYAPWLGRWVSVDSVETEPAYVYVGNNPLKFVDIDGRFGFVFELLDKAKEFVTKRHKHLQKTSKTYKALIQNLREIKSIDELVLRAKVYNLEFELNEIKMVQESSLEHDLRIINNVKPNVARTFPWTGVDMPPTLYMYDPTWWGNYPGKLRNPAIKLYTLYHSRALRAQERFFFWIRQATELVTALEAFLGELAVYSGARKILRPMMAKGLRVTSKGIARIESHLKKLRALDDPANKVMLRRLKAGKIGKPELRFYQHEIIESKIIKSYGYRGAKRAHLKTLKLQGIKYRKGYQKFLYGKKLYNKYMR